MRSETVRQWMALDDEVLTEHDSQTTTAQWTVRTQLLRNVEDGVLWQRDVFSYSNSCVTGEPCLGQKQCIQPAIHGLIM